MLKRKGIDVFLPTETKTKKVSHTPKKFKAVTYPMFTRYIFVGGKFSWLYLMSERHITGVVGFDGTPAPISKSDMERLRAMSGSNLPHRHSVNPHRALRSGELAEIQAGPFAGQIVKVEGITGSKAKIFLNLFGVRKEATISVEDLKAA
jgi:transcription antitermination factor NusG